VSLKPKPLRAGTSRAPFSCGPSRRNGVRKAALDPRPKALARAT